MGKTSPERELGRGRNVLGAAWKGEAKSCLLCVESVVRFVGEQPEGSHSMVLEVTGPKGMAGSTEEYFESETWKGQPRITDRNLKRTKCICPASQGMCDTF